MDEKEFQKLVDKFGIANAKQIKTEMENFKDDLFTVEQFNEKMDEIAKENDIPKMTESIEKMAVEIKKLREAGPKEEVSLRERLLKNEDSLKKLSNGDKSANFILDSVKTTVQRSAVSGHTLAMRLPDVGQQATAAIVIANLFRQARIGPNNNGTIRYVDQLAVTRNAATRAEAATAPESAITWIERNLPVEKMMDSIPVTHESLMDVDFIEGEINRLLEVNMALLEDNQVWDGDGATPNLVGVYQTASTFDAAADANSKQDANHWDLINSIGVKIANGKESKYMANFSVMNPLDIDKMQSKKDGNNNYVQPPFVSQDGMRVGNVSIVASPAVTQGTMLVGDFRHGTYYTSENFEIEVGWVASQFTADLMTLKARKRAALLIRTVDITAFYKVTDIDAAIEAMNA